MYRIDMEVLHAVISVIGPGPHKLHSPLLGREEQDNVKFVLESGHLSSGEWVDTFEHNLAKIVGAKHCVATVSGTAALHLLSTVMFGRSVKPVLIPSLTFVATANALAQAGLHIKFVDYSEPADINVNILGRQEPLTRGGTFHDSAQALGSVGTNGRLLGADVTSVFSFNQNKIITTGGGGAIVTNDEALYRELKHLSTTARTPHRWEVAHDAIAFNYRMPDVNAAIGCAQLDRLPKILHYKRALADAYAKAFEGIPGVEIWKEPAGTNSNQWLVAIKFKDHDDQQMALWALHNHGIQARELPKPLHLLPMYSDCKRGDMKLTEELWRSIICLPSSPALGLAHV